MKGHFSQNVLWKMFYFLRGIFLFTGIALGDHSYLFQHPDSFLCAKVCTVTRTPLHRHFFPPAQHMGQTWCLLLFGGLDNETSAFWDGGTFKEPGSMSTLQGETGGAADASLQEVTGGEGLGSLLQQLPFWPTPLGVSYGSPVMPSGISLTTQYPCLHVAIQQHCYGVVL